MKGTWLKWSVLPAALLVAGSVAMAQDQSSTQNQSGQSSPQGQAQGQSGQPSSSGSGSAETTTPAKPKPTIAQRKENQQDRIANGVKSGQLTAGETANLEKKEAAINKETAADRKANGGTLTNAEKKQINQQQNQVSKQIYKDKHNANTAKFGNNKVGQRRENQQDRIAQGIKSGQLTAGATAKLENQQKNINKQVAADRKANGGTLTTGEKKHINKEQNAASKNIYQKKHNSKTQPGTKPQS